MNLYRVTITGAADTTSIERMAELTAGFPFVEWGILRSRRREGSPRFPSLTWLQALVFHCQTNPLLPLSAHICGQWLRDLVGPQNSPLVLASVFRRAQLNFHGEPHEIDLTLAVKNLGYASDIEIICQLDTRHDPFMVLMQDRGLKVSGLFDGSHGAGVRPEKWRQPIGDYRYGYAGGIGPENVVESLEGISKVVGDRPFWIDAETALMGPDNRLDLDKCEAYLRAAQPFVATNWAELA